MGADMSADRVLSGPGAEGGAPDSQGKLIGRRYRLMSPVGRGGMGVVWHAHDVLLDRDVAVKELLLPFGLDNAGKQAAHRRVLREARSAARQTGCTRPGAGFTHTIEAHFADGGILASTGTANGAAPRAERTP